MFSVSELLKATKGKLLTGSKDARVKGVSTDTRTLQKSELFIAIKGSRFDGHDFTAAAFENGAKGAIVCSKKVASLDVVESAAKSGRFVISVDDTLSALGDIARFHRERFDIPIIAITGSNGKTTTKEMIEQILRHGWSPLKNYGTQNNLIGVPLTLLKISEKNNSAVIELGMSKPGEIRRLAEVSRPNIGVITNIGPSHLKYLKSLEAIYRAKRELLDFLNSGDIAVLNKDNHFLRRFKKNQLKIVTFGIYRKSDFRARDIKHEKGGWRFAVKGKSFFMPSAAYHDIYNALAAISVGALFNVDYAEMISVMSDYIPLEKRMSRSVIDGIEFIDDTYNSNPFSLESAIKTLSDYKAKGRKILISGDMLELGRKAAYYHTKVGRLVARSDIDNFISVGKLTRHSFLTAKRYGMQNSWFCSSKDEAAYLLKKIARPDDVVLVKGSRAMQMEDVIACFTTSFTL